jgi:hypothetical protein
MLTCIGEITPGAGKVATLAGIRPRRPATCAVRQNLAMIARRWLQFIFMVAGPAGDKRLPVPRA